MKNKESTAVIIASTQNTDITSFFSNLDVDELNNAITDIANTSASLTDSEKKYATQIIDEWTDGVVKCIKSERHRIAEFLHCVQDVPACYPKLMASHLIDVFTSLVSAAGLSNEASEIGFAIQEHNNSVYEYNTVFSAPLDIDDTIATDFEKINAKMSAAKKIIAAENKLRMTDRIKHIKLSEFNRKFAVNPYVTTAISQLKSFDRKLARTATLCKNKANEAKMAVVINDKDVREKLCALINACVK